MKVHKGKDALALLTGQAYSGEANVVCPNCRSEYTHVHHVGTLVGSDQDEAVDAYDGTATSGATPRRRSAVEIVFSCEGCNENFALVVQQHKGVNLVEVHQNVACKTE